MTTNQQRYDNDDGIDSRRDLAREYAAEHIEDVCEAHPGCVYRCICRDTQCPCGGGPYCSMHALSVGDESRCPWFEDAVQARIETMKEDAS